MEPSSGYGKLARDRIPQIIHQGGAEPVTYVAGREEYRSRLRDKLSGPRPLQSSSGTRLRAPVRRRLGTFAGMFLIPRAWSAPQAHAGQEQRIGGWDESGLASECGDLARVDATLESPLGLAGPEAVVVDRPIAVRGRLVISSVERVTTPVRLVPTGQLSSSASRSISSPSRQMPVRWSRQ